MRTFGAFYADRHLLTRLIWLLVSLVAASILVFVVVNLLPGDVGDGDAWGPMPRLRRWRH